MNFLRTALVLLAPVAGWAAEPNSARFPPPLPGPQRPVVNVAPPAVAARILPLTDTVTDAEARLELARTLSYLKRYDEALREYRKLLAARPDDGAVRAEYGQVLFWSGDAKAAYAEISRVPPGQLSAEARLALADLAVAEGRFDQAAALFAERVKTVPDDLVAQFKLAEVLSWLKRYDESLALYRGLLDARPADVQLRRRYAMVLMWAGQLDAAAAELRRTLPDS